MPTERSSDPFSARADEEILEHMLLCAEATFDELRAAFSARVGDIRPSIERLKRAGHLREALFNGKVVYRISLNSTASRASEPLSSMWSETLRDPELSVADVVGFLRSVPLFSCLPNEAVLALARRFRAANFRRHEVLVWQGEPSEVLYLIRRGVVGITHLPELVAKPQLLTFLKPGDLLGEVGVLCGSSRSATATALTDVEALSLDHDDFHALLRKCPELTLELAKMLGLRLRATNARIRGDVQGQLTLLVGAAPRLGATLIGCALAATLAHHTGKPTAYTEYPDAGPLASLLALPQGSGGTDIHKAGGGFDVLLHNRASSTPVGLHTTLITDVLENRYANSVVNVGTFQDFEELSYMLERVSSIVLITSPGTAFPEAIAELSRTLARRKPLRKATLFQVVNFSSLGGAGAESTKADVEILALTPSPSIYEVAHGRFDAMPQALMFAVTTLANRLGRTNEIGIYLPKTGDGGAGHVRQTLELFARLFGGATCSDATGIWTSPVSGLVEDNICIVRSFTTDADLDRYMGDVIDYVERLKLALGQEAVAMETNGQLMVI